MDLATLEAEVMLTGIWLNFEELEESLSIDELLALLKASNKREYEQRRFFAALQGVDIDKAAGSNDSIPMQNGEVDLQAMIERKEREWEQEEIQKHSEGKFIADDAAEIMALPGIEYGSM